MATGPGDAGTDVDTDGDVVVVSARVATEVLERVDALAGAHVLTPSRGQVLCWTCIDHRQAVAAQVVADLRAKRAARAGRGRGRGRGGAGRAVRVPTTPITPRLYGTEVEAIDEAHQCAVAAVEADADLAGTSVTRTTVIVAALRIALTTLPTATDPTTS